MRNYEVTFIVDPVLSGDEINAAAQTYVDMITKAGAKIVHINEMGLRQLAYPINRRTTGVYYCVEFQVESGAMIADLELSMRRDERIMRFLTFKLDKYGIKYNEDKRAGKIGTVKKKKKKEERDDRRGGRRDRNRGDRNSRRSNNAPAPKPTPTPVKEEVKKTQASVSVNKAAIAEEEE
ncbi:MAG: 30S ribosomal protein S6 [Bacteroidota bacterium]